MTKPCQRWPEYRARNPKARPNTGRKRAYRVVYEQAHGPLPEGMVIHHLCGNQWCVELEHLQAMTQADHVREHGLTGDWGQASKTHCPSGHPYAGDNLYIHDGERHCRACRREAKKRYRARLKERS